MTACGGYEDGDSTLTPSSLQQFKNSSVLAERLPLLKLSPGSDWPLIDFHDSDGYQHESIIGTFACLQLCAGNLFWEIGISMDFPCPDDAL